MPELKHTFRKGSWTKQFNLEKSAKSLLILTRWFQVNKQEPWVQGWVWDKGQHIPHSPGGTPGQPPAPGRTLGFVGSVGQEGSRRGLHISLQSHGPVGTAQGPPQPPPEGEAIREAINHQFVTSVKGLVFVFSLKTISVGSKWCMGFTKHCDAHRAANIAVWDFHQYPCTDLNVGDKWNLYH